MLNPYALPEKIDSLNECNFYHTMEIPGHGVVKGHWDLRPNIDKYLGEVDLRGKRVLELGTASGYVCFAMESRGAEVVAFDLPEDMSADVVPFARSDWQKRVAEYKVFMRQIRNGFWFAHRALQSRAKVVYGTVYDVPEGIGVVDVAVFGAILRHLRDPFLALQSALRLTRETVIVTEPETRPAKPRWPKSLLSRRASADRLVFAPDAASGGPETTWWNLSPGIVRRFLAVLGFETAEVKRHFQKQEGGDDVPFFTVVARRTVSMRG